MLEAHLSRESRSSETKVSRLWALLVFAALAFPNNAMQCAPIPGATPGLNGATASPFSGIGTAPAVAASVPKGAPVAAAPVPGPGKIVPQGANDNVDVNQDRLTPTPDCEANDSCGEEEARTRIAEIQAACQADGTCSEDANRAREIAAAEARIRTLEERVQRLQQEPLLRTYRDCLNMDCDSPEGERIHFDLQQAEQSLAVARANLQRLQG